jgi:hypothetical protein
MISLAGTQTFVLGKETNGSVYCYFPLAFQQIAVIEIDKSSERLYTWPITSSFSDTPNSHLLRRFHAWWHRITRTPDPPCELECGEKVTGISESGRRKFPRIFRIGNGAFVGEGCRPLGFQKA